MAIAFGPAEEAANLATHGVSLRRAADLEGAVVVEDDRFSVEPRFRAYGLIDDQPYRLAFTRWSGEVRAIGLRRTHLRSVAAMSPDDASRDDMERRLAGQPEPDLTDPNNPEWTEADFARARPIEEVLPPELIASVFPRMAKRLGRPPAAPEVKKAEVKLRLDPDVLAAWRASGPGWQTRMNEALRKAMPVGV